MLEGDEIKISKRTTKICRQFIFIYYTKPNNHNNIKTQVNNYYLVRVEFVLDAFRKYFYYARQILPLTDLSSY